MEDTDLESSSLLKTSVTVACLWPISHRKNKQRQTIENQYATSCSFNSRGCFIIYLNMSFAPSVIMHILTKIAISSRKRQRRLRSKQLIGRQRAEVERKERASKKQKKQFRMSLRLLIALSSSLQAMQVLFQILLTPLPLSNPTLTSVGTQTQAALQQ